MSKSLKDLVIEGNHAAILVYSDYCIENNISITDMLTTDTEIYYCGSSYGYDNSCSRGYGCGDGCSCGYGYGYGYLCDGSCSYGYGYGDGDGFGDSNGDGNGYGSDGISSSAMLPQY